jgi:hypothetical protein
VIRRRCRRGRRSPWRPNRARAIIGDVTGSLEVGKRADLIVIELDQTHNWPRFTRDPNAVYSQLVYAAKSTDVVHTMCDGRWLMRDRRLLTLDEDDLRRAAQEIAHRIDAFLIQREESVLQKLIAIGGAKEQESFEVQAKARVASADALALALAGNEITVIRTAHYHQYDSYFFFADPEQGRLRYREDEFWTSRIRSSTRARLTLTGPSREPRSGRCCSFARASSHRRRIHRGSTGSISSRFASARSRRIAAAGSLPTEASTSTCTSTVS